MAEDDDTGADFDTEMGGDDSGAGRQESERDTDDDLEDLSREELYDRLKDANNTAKKYRLRLKRARQSSTGSRRDSGRYRGEEDDDRDDDSRDGDRRSSNRDRGRGDRERDDRGRSSDRRRDDRRADREVEQYEERAIRAEAKSALAAAGIPADRLSRAVRLIDLRNLEFDDEDELLGIQEEIEDLREEWPELFRKPRSRDDEDDDNRDSRTTRRRIPRADTRAGGGRGSRNGRREKTATEIQAELLSKFAGK